MLAFTYHYSNNKSVGLCHCICLEKLWGIQVKYKHHFVFSFLLHYCLFCIMHCMTKGNQLETSIFTLVYLLWSFHFALSLQNMLTPHIYKLNCCSYQQ